MRWGAAGLYCSGFADQQIGNIAVRMSRHIKCVFILELLA
jgi:hypothetical protein